MWEFSRLKGNISNLRGNMGNSIDGARTREWLANKNSGISYLITFTKINSIEIKNLNEQK